MAKKAGRPRRVADQDIRQSTLATFERYRLARQVVRAAIWMFGLWQMRLGVEAVSGQDTQLIVNATLGIFADLKFSLAVTLAGGATAWALVERYTRQRSVERIQGRIRQLEQTTDPGRTSSGLTPKGATSARDKEAAG